MPERSARCRAAYSLLTATNPPCCFGGVNRSLYAATPQGLAILRLLPFDPGGVHVVAVVAAHVSR